MFVEEETAKVFPPKLINCSTENFGLQLSET